MASSVLTKSFTNKVKRSASNNISFSNLGGFLRQTFNSISNNFVNARPTMESSFQNVYLLFSNIRRRIEDLRFHEKKIWFPQTNTIFCTAMGKAWDKSLIFLLHPCKTIMFHTEIVARKDDLHTYFLLVSLVEKDHESTFFFKISV